MRVFCISGDSGAGKTAFIERLILHLPVDLPRLGLLKHTHHRLDWHPPRKDSTLFWNTGVGAVGVLDPLQCACFNRRGNPTSTDSNKTGPEDSLAVDEETLQTEELATTCRLFPENVALVLAEGFTRARVPKVWLTTVPHGTAGSFLPSSARAVLTTEEAKDSWERAATDLPVYGRDDVQTIAARVWDWAVPVEDLA